MCVIPNCIHFFEKIFFESTYCSFDSPADAVWIAIKQQTATNIQVVVVPNILFFSFTGSGFRWFTGEFINFKIHRNGSNTGWWFVQIESELCCYCCESCFFQLRSQFFTHFMRTALKFLNSFLLNVKQFENYSRFDSNGWKFKCFEAKEKLQFKQRSQFFVSMIMLLSFIFHSIIPTEVWNFLFLWSSSSSHFFSCKFFHWFLFIHLFA